MLTFFGTILILYLVWLIVKPLLLSYARRKYTQKVNDMFNQAFGGGTGFSPGASPFGQQRRQQHQPRGRKKIFSRDEGEYVDFEEIEVKTEFSASETNEKQGSSYTPREPQVSDADWEEIR